MFGARQADRQPPRQGKRCGGGSQREVVRMCAADGPVPKLPVLPPQSSIAGGQAHGSMNWVTMRRIMRIAYVVVAAATIAGRGLFFWGPSRAGALLPSAARLARESLTGARADRSAYQPLTGIFCALWPVGWPHRFASIGPFGTRGPGPLRCGPRTAKHIHC